MSLIKASFVFLNFLKGLFYTFISFAMIMVVISQAFPGTYYSEIVLLYVMFIVAPSLTLYVPLFLDGANFKPTRISISLFKIVAWSNMGILILIMLSDKTNLVYNKNLLLVYLSLFVITTLIASILMFYSFWYYKKREEFKS